MKRKRGVTRLLPFVASLLLLPALLPTTAEAMTARVSVTFKDADGRGLSGATVAVYVDRFGRPTPKDAQLIASGVADATGQFEFKLRAGLSSKMNATVYAVDFDRMVMASYDAVLPANRNSHHVFVANVRIPKRSVVEQKAGMGLASKTTDEKKIGEKPKWTRVSQHHIGSGFNGRFCFLEGHDTKTQIAVRFKAVAGGWGEWEIGGWRVEEKGRAAGSCSPSPAAKPKGKKGPFHELRLARYKFYKYKIENWLCDPGGGGCVRSVKKQWRPDHWMGSLRIDKKIRLDQAERLPGNYIRLDPGDDFWKDTKENTEFGAGVNLVGLELNSQAGYSKVTKIWWLSTKRCKRNFLFGGGTDPADAQGPIYSKSKGC